MLRGIADTRGPVVSTSKEDNLNIIVDGKVG